jgi:hypothetical protein
MSCQGGLKIEILFLKNTKISILVVFQSFIFGQNLAILVVLNSFGQIWPDFPIFIVAEHAQTWTEIFKTP